MHLYQQPLKCKALLQFTTDCVQIIGLWTIFTMLFSAVHAIFCQEDDLSAWWQFDFQNTRGLAKPLPWKSMLQVRLELTTSAWLRKLNTSTAYKYGALTDCATGARRQSRVLKPYQFWAEFEVIKCLMQWYMVHVFVCGTTVYVLYQASLMQSDLLIILTNIEII